MMEEGGVEEPGSLWTAWPRGCSINPELAASRLLNTRQKCNLRLVLVTVILILCHLLPGAILY